MNKEPIIFDGKEKETGSIYATSQLIMPSDLGHNTPCVPKLRICFRQTLTSSNTESTPTSIALRVDTGDSFNLAFSLPSSTNSTPGSSFLSRGPKTLPTRLTPGSQGVSGRHRNHRPTRKRRRRPSCHDDEDSDQEWSLPGTGTGRRGQSVRTPTNIDLDSSDSIITKVNLRNVVNRGTFDELPPAYQYQLTQLLPQCDRVLDLNGAARLHPTALTNEFIAKALQDYPTRQGRGEFSPTLRSGNRAGLRGSALPSTSSSCSLSTLGSSCLISTNAPVVPVLSSSSIEPDVCDAWKTAYFEEYWGQSLTPSTSPDKSSAPSPSPPHTATSARTPPCHQEDTEDSQQTVPAEDLTPTISITKRRRRGRSAIARRRRAPKKKVSVSPYTHEWTEQVGQCLKQEGEGDESSSTPPARLLRSNDDSHSTGGSSTVKSEELSPCGSAASSSTTEADHLASVVVAASVSDSVINTTFPALPSPPPKEEDPPMPTMPPPRQTKTLAAMREKMRARRCLNEATRLQTGQTPRYEPANDYQLPIGPAFCDRSDLSPQSTIKEFSYCKSLRLEAGSCQKMELKSPIEESLSFSCSSPLYHPTSYSIIHKSPLMENTLESIQDQKSSPSTTDPIFNCDNVNTSILSSSSCLLPSMCSGNLSTSVAEKSNDDTDSSPNGTVYRENIFTKFSTVTSPINDGLVTVSPPPLADDMVNESSSVNTVDLIHESSYDSRTEILVHESSSPPITDTMDYIKCSPLVNDNLVHESSSEKISNFTDIDSYTTSITEDILHVPSSQPITEDILHVPSSQPTSDDILHEPSSQPTSDDILHEPSSQPTSDDILHEPSSQPTSDDILNEISSQPTSDDILHEPSPELITLDIVHESTVQPITNDLLHESSSLKSTQNVDYISSSGPITNQPFIHDIVHESSSPPITNELINESPSQITDKLVHISSSKPIISKVVSVFSSPPNTEKQVFTQSIANSQMSVSSLPIDMSVSFVPASSCSQGKLNNNTYTSGKCLGFCKGKSMIPCSECGKYVHGECFENGNSCVDCRHGQSSCKLDNVSLD